MFSLVIETVFHKNINIDIFIFLFFCIVGWMSILSIEYKPEIPFFEGLLNRHTNYSKQLIWILISLFIGIFIINTNSKIFASFGYFPYIIGIVLMVLTIFSGSNFRGSKSWLSIGGVVQLQVVQIMFITTPLALAKYISNYDINSGKLKDKLIPFLLIITPLVLTVYQSETGLALVFLSLFIILYREGFSIFLLLLPIYLLILLICSITFSPIVFIISISVIYVSIIIIFKKFLFKQKLLMFILALIFTLTGLLQAKIIPYLMNKSLAPYQIKRLEHTFKPSFNKKQQTTKEKKAENYNVKQSIVAIGSGGIFGKGFLNNMQTRLDFVPEQATDFIICSFAESFGFLGILILLSMYLFMLLRVLSFAEKQRSIFSRCYCYSFVAIIFFHLIVNLGMTIGIVPVIGIPLPFISYGGGSFLTFSIMYFIVVRLDMDRQIVIK